MPTKADDFFNSKATSQPSADTESGGSEADKFFRSKVAPTPAPQPVVGRDTTEPASEPGVDEALVNKIMTTSNVDRGEAVRRARNTAALLRSGKTGTISQGESPSGTGAFVEGAIQGAVPFGMGPLVGPPVEALFSYIPGLEDLDMESQARRREENAGAFLAGEVGGSLLTGGTSLLVKGGSRLAETAAGRAVRALDIGEKVSGRLAARAAGTTLKTEMDAVENVIPLLRDRVKSGFPLTKAESQVLQTYERLASPTLYEKAATKVMPRLGSATELAEENATRILAERAAADKITRSMKALGMKGIPQGALEVGKAALVPAVSTAIDAASYAGSSAVRDFLTLTPEQVDATGENVATIYLKNAAKGGGAGFVLGGAIPSVVAGLGQTGRLVRKAGDELTELIYPHIGSIFGRASKEEIREAIVAGGALSKIDLRKREQQFVAQLQAQYDASGKYLDHLRVVSNKAADDLGLPANAPERRLGQLDDVLEAVRKKYMFRNEKGQYLYRSDRVVDDFYKGPVVDIETTSVDPATGRLIREVVGQKLTLPNEITTLQERLQTLEQTLGDVYGRANATKPSATTRSVPATLMDARKYGARLMQENVLPPTIRAPYAELGETAPVGLYTRQATPFEPNFGVLKQTADVRQADVKTAGRGIAEIGGPAWLASQFLDIAGPEALGGATAAKYAVDMLFAPGNIIDNYRTAQAVVSYGIKRSNDFARFLVSGPTTGAGFVARKFMPKELYKAGISEAPGIKVKPNIGLSKAEAQEYFEEDRALVNKLESQGAAGSLDQIFGGNIDELEGMFPNMANAAVSTLPRQVMFMKEKLKGLPEKPTTAQVYQYGLYSRYVRDVDAIFDDIAEKKYVPNQALEVLTQVYPATYNQLAQTLLSEVVDAQQKKQKIDSKQMAIIYKLLGKTPADLTPDKIKAVQATFQESAPPAGSGGPTSNRRVELEREGTSQGK